MDADYEYNAYYNTSFSKVHLGELSPRDQKTAEMELREHPEERMKAIEELRNMIPEAIRCNINTSDAFLIQFLRVRKYDKDKALKTLKNFYNKRDKMKIFTKDPLLPSSVMDIFETGIVTLFPKRNKEGRLVALFDTGKWDPSWLPLSRIFQFAFMVTVKFLQAEFFQINGLCLIMDFGGFSLRQLQQCTPYYVYMFVSIAQDALPLRVKEVHIIRESVVFDLLWKLAKPLIKPKIRSRFHFHGHDLSSLHRHVSPDILTPDLEGTFAELNNGEYQNILRASEAEFKACLNHGYHT